MTTLKLTAEYASQATELNNRIPYGYVNKTICGCGLTTLALENRFDTIIAVPSVTLIENKTVQYPNQRTNNIVFGVYGGVSQDEINNYLVSCAVNRLPVKIMVTYDSLWKVETLMSQCDIVVDESDRLLMSSKLKLSNKKDAKDTDVLTYLFSVLYTHRDRVSFISATPTPVTYLPEWVQQLEQITIEWDNVIVAKPYLMQRTYPTKSLSEEIIKPLSVSGKVNISDITATKVIVFLNSVTEIMKVIKDCNIEPEDVALVIGDTAANDVKIKGYNRLTDPKSLPMFTFCTSTGFQGIDLEDNDALSVVVSSTSKSFTMIDLSTDLKQAISRQRLKSNVHYGKYVYLYNQSVFEKSEQELIDTLNELESSLNDSITLWEVAKKQGLTRGFRIDADFIAYTIHNAEDDSYVLNTLAFNADRYFILETRRQYEKGFNLRGNFTDADDVCKVILPNNVAYKDLVFYYKENGHREDFTWGVYSTKTEWIDVIETYIKLYEKCPPVDYTRAKALIECYTNPVKQLRIHVHAAFKTEQNYTRSEIKDTLQKMYDKAGIKRKAKHTDFFEFFTEVVEKKVQGERMMMIVKK